MAWLPLLLEFMDDNGDDNISGQIVESCESDSDINSTMVAAAATVFGCRSEHVLRGCVQGFYSTVIPKYSPDAFKSHFRMSRTSFEILCREVAAVMAPNERQMRVTLPEKTAMAIWGLANEETFREIGNLFGMNRGNAHFCIFQILRLIGDNLKPEYIKWPNSSECRTIASAFEEATGMSGVIGCIDGTHIRVKPPADDRDSYINRKGYPSINVLAVCDNAKKFTYVYADRAGSVHDARVLRVSSLGEMIESGTLCSGDDKEKYHLLGDSAYPLLTNLVVPYRDNGHLTPTQTRFNNIHSSTRSVVERAFGRVKGMFRRLRGIDCTYPVNALCMIEAAFVLHNFILHNEHASDDYDDDDGTDVDGSDLAATSLETTAESGSATMRKAARDKRDKLADTL